LDAESDGTQTEGEGEEKAQDKRTTTAKKPIVKLTTKNLQEFECESTKTPLMPSLKSSPRQQSRRSKSIVKSHMSERKSNLRILTTDKIFETTSQVGSIIPKSTHP
jgi:hypothetical protein